jgi:hypothetical protein
MENGGYLPDDDIENHAERVKNEKLSLSLSPIGSDRIGSDRILALLFFSLSLLCPPTPSSRDRRSFLLSSSRLVSLFIFDDDEINYFRHSFWHFFSVVKDFERDLSFFSLQKRFRREFLLLLRDFFFRRRLLCLFFLLLLLFRPSSSSSSFSSSSSAKNSGRVFFKNRDFFHRFDDENNT